MFVGAEQWAWTQFDSDNSCLWVLNSELGLNLTVAIHGSSR